MRNNNHPSVLGMDPADCRLFQCQRYAKAVKAELESQSKNRQDWNTKINYDVTEFLYVSIEEVVKTLAITLLLVFFVVYIFLQDFRSTLIPLIAVPVSLIGTFFFLRYSILHQLAHALGVAVGDSDSGR